MADEKFGVAISLRNLVSAPAKKILGALGQLTKAEEAVTTAATATNTVIAQQGAAAATAAVGIDRLASAQARLSRSARMLGRTGNLINTNYTKSGVSGASSSVIGKMYGPILDRRAQSQSMSMTAKFRANMSSMGSGLKTLYGAASDVTSQWSEMSGAFMRTPLGLLAGGLMSVGGALYDMGKYLVNAAVTAGKLVVVLGAVAAVAFTKKVVEMAALAESSRLAFKYLTGSEAGSKEWFGASIAQAKDLGLDITDTLDSFKQLRAQQFELGQATALVRMSADLVAVTGHADAASRSIRAITQIKSAGRLQGDELNQLAEAGVSRDLIYAELEKSLKTNRAGVLSKQSAGDIDAATAIAAIQKAVGNKLHTKNAGDAAKAALDSTLTGMWRQLVNLPDLVLLELGEKVDTSPLVTSLKVVRDAILGATQGPMIGLVNRMVGGLAALVPLTVEFAQGFADGLENINRALGISGEVTKGAARSAGKALSDFFVEVINGAKWLMREVPPAIQAFMNNLDASGLLASLRSADWAGLGRDLVTIGGALGSIANGAARLVKYFALDGGVGDVANTALNVVQGGGNPIGTAVNAGLDAVGGTGMWDWIANKFSGEQNAPAKGQVEVKISLDDNRIGVKTKSKGRGVNVNAGPAMQGAGL